MSIVSVNTCPVCGGKEFSSFLICKDYTVSSEEFALVQCRTCEFVMTKDFPSEDEIGKYYNSQDYISHSDTHKGLINKLYHIARSIALKSKAKIVLEHADIEHGRLIDIGCGTGYFLNTMKQKGWLVTGAEKDSGARKYAKTKFDLNIQTHEYLFDIIPNQKDVVTMWHVLEHVEHLNETMNQLYKILAEDGIAIIALPNRESLDAEYYKEYWAAYDVPRHLWHFSQSNFESLANKHNFILEDIKPMYFDAFYISMLSEKYKGTFAGTLIGLMRGLKFYLSSLSDTGRCSSIVYVLKKKRIKE